MLETAAGQPHIPVEDWTDERWRSLVADGARAYLSPAFDPAQPPSIAALAAERYGATVDPESPALMKADRHAVIGAAIHRITAKIVQGNGATARYTRIHPTVSSNLPLFQLQYGLTGTFAHGTRAAEADPASNVTHFLERFDRLSQSVKFGVDSHFVRHGGTFSEEMRHFADVTSYKMQTLPVTKAMAPKERLEVAHGLLSLERARASHHFDTIDQVSWLGVEHRSELREYTRLSSETGETLRSAFRLVGEDGLPLFMLAAEVRKTLATPLLKCPAHQHLFAGSGSALERHAHAAVNYMGELGIYG